jgi:hypothetical protein
MWGKDIKANGAARFTEAESKKTGNYLPDGYKIMESLTRK